MKKFAYLDTAKILHITKDEKTAKSHSFNGKFIETEFPAKGGYPVDGKGNFYVVYSETEEKHGRKIPVEIAGLYSKLK